jgi:predicted nuclease of predicted toxin-antitoxin system
VTETRAKRERPRVRLLWDENLSSLVPKALQVLGFRVTWVGSDAEGVPPKGSTDAEVAGFARRANQVIVTSNHDMMTLCDELGQRFVWLDPRGKKLPREAQVLLVFKQIAAWEKVLSEQPGMCVHARRTSCKAIASAEAARLARNRMRELSRRSQRKRRAARIETPGQGTAL